MIHGLRPAGRPDGRGSAPRCTPGSARALGVDASDIATGWPNSRPLRTLPAHPAEIKGGRSRRDLQAGGRRPMTGVARLRAGPSRGRAVQALVEGAAEHRLELGPIGAGPGRLEVIVVRLPAPPDLDDRRVVRARQFLEHLHPDGPRVLPALRRELAEERPPVGGEFRQDVDVGDHAEGFALVLRPGRGRPIWEDRRADQRRRHHRDRLPHRPPLSLRPARPGPAGRPHEFVAGPRPGIRIPCRRRHRPDPAEIRRVPRKTRITAPPIL